MYFFIESISLNITLFMFSFLDSWNLNDIDSARYLISAVIQSECAIISIIITLSLIGVQIIAQKYSTYATDIFKKYPDIWIILSIYLVSIIVGVFSLVNISRGEVVIFLVIFLFIFCLFALGPYIWNMMTIFRPENILTILKFKIINTLPDSKTNSCSDFLNSDIISIFDIIITSIKNNDTNTTNFGFLQLFDLITNISYDDRLFKINLYLSDYSNLSQNIINSYSEDQIIKIKEQFKILQTTIEIKEKKERLNKYL